MLKRFRNVLAKVQPIPYIYDVTLWFARRMKGGGVNQSPLSLDFLLGMEALKYPLQGGKQVQNSTIFAALSEPQVI